jgi:hypothetical protein
MELEKKHQCGQHLGHDTTLPERPYLGHWESTYKYTQVKGLQYGLRKSQIAWKSGLLEEEFTRQVGTFEITVIGGRGEGGHGE